LVAALSPLYDFVLYTMGSRAYAEAVGAVIDRQFGPRVAGGSGVVIGQRIICREDHSQINDREYKKDVARFAPIDREWCIVLDDTPEVWVRRDDVHRLPKYLFWPNPKDKNSGNPSSTDSSGGAGDPPATAKTSIWSKNSITSWDDERSLRRQDNDTVLLQAIEICKAVHHCYYSQWTPSQTVAVSAPDIYSLIRRRILHQKEVVFTGVFPRRESANDFHPKFAKLFGAKMSDQITESTTHLIGRGSKTGKIQEALKRGDIEIVHINWLYQTMFAFARADEHKFRMFKQGGNTQNTPKMHCNIKVRAMKELLAMYRAEAS